jgi:hypothetical protein
VVLIGNLGPEMLINRTRQNGTVRPLANFECGAFNHSATSPSVQRKTSAPRLCIQRTRAKQGRSEPASGRLRAEIATARDRARDRS